jgi:hypothetical protein
MGGNCSNEVTPVERSPTLTKLYFKQHSSFSSNKSDGGEKTHGLTMVQTISIVQETVQGGKQQSIQKATHPAVKRAIAESGDVRLRKASTETDVAKLKKSAAQLTRGAMASPVHDNGRGDNGFGKYGNNSVVICVIDFERVIDGDVYQSLRASLNSTVSKMEVDFYPNGRYFVLICYRDMQVSQAPALGLVPEKKTVNGFQYMLNCAIDVCNELRKFRTNFKIGLHVGNVSGGFISNSIANAITTSKGAEDKGIMFSLLYIENMRTTECFEDCFDDVAKRLWNTA